MTGKKVLITQPIRPKGIEELSKKALVTISPSPDKDTVRELVPGFDALITRTTRIDRDIIEKGIKLKAIAAHGTGFDLIDVEAATQHKIAVLHAPGTNARSVAEMVVAAMLALSRHLVKADYALRINRQYSERDRLVGNDLSEKIVGIIGFGHVGKILAKICSKGFDTKVQVFDPWLKDEDFAGHNVTRVDLARLLSSSDFVSVNCPLTKDTRGLIGKEEIELMKESAYLINYARGPIVDKRAIITALENERLAGAAFDMFWEEPPPEDCPFFDLPNVIATPHVAAFAHESLDKMSLTIVHDILRVFQGEKPYYMANQEAWDSST